MSKPLWYRWGRVYFAGTCIIGSGVLLFKYTTPTDEQLIAAFSPEVREEYERNRELRRLEQAEVMRIAIETSKSNNPIWMTGAIGSPFERDQRNPNQQLVDYAAVKKKQADDKMKEEMQEANKELLEVQKLAAEKNKGWSKLLPWK